VLEELCGLLTGHLHQSSLVQTLLLAAESVQFRPGSVPVRSQTGRVRSACPASLPTGILQPGTKKESIKNQEFIRLKSISCVSGHCCFLPHIYTLIFLYTSKRGGGGGDFAEIIVIVWEHTDILCSTHGFMYILEYYVYCSSLAIHRDSLTRLDLPGSVQ
jgi:hypothetical protein